MKIYRANRAETGTQVFVDVPDHLKLEVYELNPRFDLRNHSPSGFEWGYGGEGPAQLALAILADFLDYKHMAIVWYQDFKSAVVAKLPHENWVLDEEDISEALAALGLPV